MNLNIVFSKLIINPLQFSQNPLQKERVLLFLGWKKGGSSANQKKPILNEYIFPVSPPTRKKIGAK
jgi:hypothetical protein